MDQDTIEKARKKKRLIAEIRYKPMPAIFDNRGKVIDTLYPEFEEKGLKHWQGQNAAVAVLDESPNPARMIHLDHARASVVYEDSEPVQEFQLDASKALTQIQLLFPRHLAVLERVGVRFISVFRLPTKSSLEQITHAVCDHYFAKPLSLTGQIKDVQVALNFNCRNVRIGPTYRDDVWANKVFQRIEEGMPPIGLGVDIDCFLEDVDCARDGLLADSLAEAYDLVHTTENEILQHFL